MNVKDCRQCDGCAMQKLFPLNNLVPPKMGTGKRLVVAEAPGEEESIKLEPLVGGAGQVFDGLCGKAGISRDSLTLANTIQCRPPGNKYPLSEDAKEYISPDDGRKAVEQCFRNHLLPVIQERKWERVDALGNWALERLTGETGITQWRGQLLALKDRPELGEIVVPTIHPAALMRDQLMTPIVVSDLKKSLIQPPETYILHPNVSDVRSFRATEFCFDIENNPFTGEVYMVGITDRAYQAMCVPFTAPYIPELKRIFKEAKVLIGQNIISHDIPHLQRAGIPFPEEYQIWDTMLMNHLLFPQFSGEASSDSEEDSKGKTTSGGHSLAFIGSVFTSKPRWKHLMGDNKELYCCRDTDVQMQVYPQQRALLEQFSLMDVYNLVSVPVAKICHLMKATGMLRDPGKIDKVRAQYLKKASELELVLPEELRTQQVKARKRELIPEDQRRKRKNGTYTTYQLVDTTKEVTPWRSDKTIGKWLYESLKLPVQKHVKTKKTTTDKMALERLSRLEKTPSEIRKQIMAVRELRSIDETLTTFATDEMRDVLSVHANFNVTGTNSGRLSSSEPNMQNVPDPTRCIYIPHRENWSIIQCDFSSIENRITAHMAHDTERLERFSIPDFSEHKWAVEQFYGIPMAQVKKSSDPESPYSICKHVVHGTNYGLGPRKMSLMYGFPEKVAKEKQAQWKGAIPKTVAWQEQISQQAHTDGFLTNPFGRKNWFYTSSWYTKSLSFIPQSTAADIILRCMIGLYYERVGWSRERAVEVCPVSQPLPRPAQLLLQVHDALVVECPNHMVDEIVGYLKQVMEQPWPQMGGFICPIAIEVGSSWGELSKYTYPFTSVSSQ